jgi:CyaY protein
MMTDAEFSQMAEQLYSRIEEALDDLIERQHAELDYENNGGVLIIHCEDSDTQVIVSRQGATHQIWLAAKSGGFHCNHEETQWRCSKTQETLSELLSRTCSEQSQKDIAFPELGAQT